VIHLDINASLATKVIQPINTNIPLQESNNATKARSIVEKIYLLNTQSHTKENIQGLHLED